MTPELGPPDIAHSHYHAILKNRRHIPDANHGSPVTVTTVQTEKRVGKPGCRPAGVNVRTGRCRDAGAVYPTGNGLSE